MKRINPVNPRLPYAWRVYADEPLAPEQSIQKSAELAGVAVPSSNAKTWTPKASKELEAAAKAVDEGKTPEQMPTRTSERVKGKRGGKKTRRHRRHSKKTKRHSRRSK